MKCRVCLNYLLDVPDKEIDASAEKIADDAKWLIDNYTYEAYWSFVEKMGDDND